MTDWFPEDRRRLIQAVERIADVLEERLPPMSEVNDNEFLKRQLHMARERETKLMETMKTMQVPVCEHIDAEDAELEIESLAEQITRLRSRVDVKEQEANEMRGRLAGYDNREKNEVAALRRALQALPQQENERQEVGFPVYNVSVRNTLLVEIRDVVALLDRIKVL